MEGGHPELARRPADHRFKPLPHFLSGFVGKSDGQDLRRVNPALGDQVGDPVDHGARFPRAGPGDHQGRAEVVEDNASLFVVERSEQIVHRVMESTVPRPRRANPLP